MNKIFVILYQCQFPTFEHSSIVTYNAITEESWVRGPQELEVLVFATTMRIWNYFKKCKKKKKNIKQKMPTRI